MQRLVRKASTLLFFRLPTLLSVSLSRYLRRRPSIHGVRHILLLRLDGLGDCVMTLPALAALKQCFPSATLTVVARESAAPIFAGTSFVDEVLPFQLPRSSGKLAELRVATQFFRRSLRQRQFDIAINPRWDSDLSYATYLCALARAPLSAGYEDATTPDKLRLNGGFDRAYNLRLPAGPLQHEVQRNLDLVRALGCSVIDLTPRLTTTPEQRAEAQHWLPPRPQAAWLLALGLPAAASKRRWDAAHYIALLHDLEHSLEIRPILFADRDTLSAAKEIQSTFPHSRIAANLTLASVCAILQACDLFVGSDSGLAHVAAALGLPTVTLSPHPKNADPAHPNSPDRFRPFSEKSIVVQPATARTGCEAGCDSQEAHCILDVDTDEIARAIKALLATKDAI